MTFENKWCSTQFLSISVGICTKKLAVKLEKHAENCYYVFCYLSENVHYTIDSVSPLQENECF